MRVAIIAPRTFGGVSTVYNNLLRGLIKDKISVQLFKLYRLKPRSTMLHTILYDLKNIRQLKNFDVIIYIGSIPWPSINLLSALDIKKILFVHGFIYHEILSTIKRRNVRSKIAEILALSMYDLARFLKSVDYYICHHNSTCDMSRVPREKQILLPQFFLEEDLNFYKFLGYTYKYRMNHENNTIRIVTYGSNAHSPRLLAFRHIITLGKILKHRIKNKKIEFVVIDPRYESYEDRVIRVIKPLPREKYLRLVASSDLYIERCVDEELGYGALEAMAMGTPVAKVTHPVYRSNIDYENAIINAQTITSLARDISYAIEQNNLAKYSKAGMEYVKDKRTWNSVKFKLYETLFR